MSRRAVNLNPELNDYALAHTTPPDPLLAELIEETYAVLPDRAQMQVSPDQAAFLELLARARGVKAAVEIGTFTGMSSLSIARGMGKDGRLICFDISEEFTSIARRYWERDGLSERIELRIGDAKAKVAELPEGQWIDMAFIDADKTGYLEYWTQLAPRMSPGGIIAVDNVFQGGRVIDDESNGEAVVAIRAFNDHVLSDDRFKVTMLSIADGLTLAERRS